MEQHEKIVGPDMPEGVKWIHYLLARPRREWAVMIELVKRAPVLSVLFILLVTAVNHYGFAYFYRYQTQEIAFLKTKMEHYQELFPDQTAQEVHDRIEALETESAPRSLNEDMKSFLDLALKRFAGTQIKIVNSPSVEATALASQIVGALESAGWSVSSTIGVIEDDTVVFPFAGTELVVNGASGQVLQNPALVRLAKALGCLGIEVRAIHDPSLREGQAKLMVGDKPPSGEGALTLSPETPCAALVRAE